MRYNCVTVTTYLPVLSSQDEYWPKDCGDGSFEGHSYFSCGHGHGYFHPLKNVQPDQRFLTIDPVPAITRGNSIPAENRKLHSLIMIPNRIIIVSV